MKNAIMKDTQRIEIKTHMKMIRQTIKYQDNRDMQLQHFVISLENHPDQRD